MTEWIDVLLPQMRRNLSWLRDDGYRETDTQVLRSRFHLRFTGPHGRIIVTVNPGMSELEIWMRPAGMSGTGPAMQEYLQARGLPAPQQRIDGTSLAAVQRAVDDHAAALKLLRDKELAGDWSPLPDHAARIAESRARRAALINEIVQRASKDSAP